MSTETETFEAFADRMWPGKPIPGEALTVWHYQQRKIDNLVARAALVPAPPESRDTPPRQTFEAWHNAYEPAGRGGSWDYIRNADLRKRCRREGWDAAIVAASGAAGATTAAAQEEP